MTNTRHLHKTPLLTYCGRDASYILMTFDPKETKCKVCLRAHKAAAVKENA